MSEFKVIETQEQLDAIIADRLKREKEASAKRYEGWISPDKHAEAIKKFEDAAAETEKQLKAKDEEIAKGETYRTDLAKTRIALAAGLKMDYATRLRGETEEEWKADAELLAKDFKAAHFSAPLGQSEPEPGSTPQTREEFANWIKEQFNN